MAQDNTSSVIVKNFSDGASEETLAMFLENLCSDFEAEVSVEFNLNRTLALASFSTAIDVDSLREKAKSKPYLSCHLILESCPTQHKIVVLGLPPDETFDSVILWFESSLGDVDDATSEMKNGVAILTFLNTEDMQKAVSKPNLNFKKETVLKVERWTPLFEFPEKSSYQGDLTQTHDDFNQLGLEDHLTPETDHQSTGREEDPAEDGSQTMTRSFSMSSISSQNSDRSSDFDGPGQRGRGRGRRPYRGKNRGNRGKENSYRGQRGNDYVYRGHRGNDNVYRGHRGSDNGYRGHRGNDNGYRGQEYRGNRGRGGRGNDRGYQGHDNRGNYRGNNYRGPGGYQGHPHRGGHSSNNQTDTGDGPPFHQYRGHDDHQGHSYRGAHNSNNQGLLGDGPPLNEYNTGNPYFSGNPEQSDRGYHSNRGDYRGRGQGYDGFHQRGGPPRGRGEYHPRGQHLAPGHPRGAPRMQQPRTIPSLIDLPLPDSRGASPERYSPHSSQSAPIENRPSKQSSTSKMTTPESIWPAVLPIPAEKIKLIKLALRKDQAFITVPDPEYRFEEEKGLVRLKNNELKLTFYEILNNICELPLRNEKSARYLASRHLKRVMELFEEKSCICLVYVKEGKPLILGINDEEANLGEKLLKEYALEIFTECLDLKNYNQATKSQDWKRALQTLQESVDIITDSTTVIITGHKNEVDTACTVLKSMLADYQVVTKDVQLDRGAWYLLRDHSSDQTLYRVLSEMKRKKNVQIKYENTGDAFILRLTGTEAHLKNASSHVDSLLKNISTENMKITKPGISKHFLKGNSFVITIGKGHQCMVDVLDDNPVITAAAARSITRPNHSPTAEQYQEPQGAYGGDFYDIEAAEFVTSKRSTSIHVHQGDIRTISADALVCTVADGKQLKDGGAIAKAFLETGGTPLQQGFNNLKLVDGTLATGQCYSVINDTGAFGGCQLLIFEALKPWRDNNPRQLSAVRNMIVRCLQMVEQYGLSSIAFPTIGCGGFKFPVDQVAKAFNEAMDLWQEINGHYPIKVKVVAYEEKIYREFKATVNRKSDSSSTRRGAEVARPASTTSYQPQTPKTSSVTLKLTAWTQKAIELMKKDLNQYIETLVFEDMIDSPALKTLSSRDKTAIQRLNTNKVSIEVDERRGRVKVEGDKKAVVETMSKANAIIRQAEIKFEKEKDTPEYAKKYEGHAAFLIKLSQEETKLPSHWKYYKGKLTDIFSKIKGKQYSKVSPDLYAAVEKMMKTTWKSTLVGHGKDARNQAGSNLRISEILQIENPDVYNDYSAKKRKFCLRAAKKKFSSLSDIHGEKDVMTKTAAIPELDRILLPDVNEVFLFHGTATENADAIAEQGLDSRVGSSTGMFGQGVYFAESSTKSDQYAHSGGGMMAKTKAALYGLGPGYGVLRAASGVRSAFLCRVLVGNAYVCSTPTPYQRPPCTQLCTGACAHSDMFDSVVGVSGGSGGRLNFREFVVYDKGQCYPEFLIKYTCV